MARLTGFGEAILRVEAERAAQPPETARVPTPQPARKPTDRTAWATKRRDNAAARVGRLKTALARLELDPPQPLDHGKLNIPLKGARARDLDKTITNAVTHQHLTKALRYAQARLTYWERITNE